MIGPGDLRSHICDRGVYFATMSEAQVPMGLTGTVSGFASAIKRPDLLAACSFYPGALWLQDHLKVGSSLENLINKTLLAWSIGKDQKNAL